MNLVNLNRAKGEYEIKYYWVHVAQFPPVTTEVTVPYAAPMRHYLFDYL